MLVKDYDGHLKVLSHGELREVQEYLVQAESPPSAPGLRLDGAGTAGSAGGPSKLLPASQVVSFPVFTDLALMPPDEHFREPDGSASLTTDEKATPSGTTALHFHADDQHEIIRELAKLQQLFKVGPQKQYSIQKIAQKLADKHGLRFSPPDFAKFAMILLSGFRQARSFTMIRERLIAPREASGLELPGETADRIISIARSLKQKIESVDGIVIDERAVAAPKAGVEKQSPGQPVRTTPTRMTPPPAPVMPAVASQKTQSASSPATPRTEATRPAVPPSVEPRPMAQRPVAAPRPAFDLPRVVRPQSPIQPLGEVKRPTKRAANKLMGPIDELAAMDLATWRLLDPDPRIRAGKILGRIKNLEQESLLRKSQGVDAWRSNEVYHRYLEIGQKSLEQKTDVSAIIRSLEASGRMTLALDEFEAITDLNRALRF